jgi:hypothetical protein
MGLFKIATLGALGYAGYQYYQENFAHQGRAALAGNQPDSGHSTVRDAGPEAMRDQPRREWEKADEISDESFPASDPPATY